MRLGEILLRKGYLQPPQLEAALLKQETGPPRRLAEILCADGTITEAMLAEALAEQFDLPWIAKVEDALLAPDLVEKLSVDWARAQVMLPVRHHGRTEVLTADPAAVAELDNLSLLLGQDVTPVVAPRSEILRAIEQCYFQRAPAQSAGEPAGILEEAAAPAGRTSDDLLRGSDQAPVTQLVNRMLLDAVRRRASDIHIEPFEDRLQVRFRIDGVLYEQAPPARALEPALVARLKVMARLDIAERRLPQDGMAKVRVGEREIDIRVSTVPVAEGERVVLRLLNRDTLLLPLTELGMPAHVERQFLDLLQAPHGVVLVTGPTGSGKTTTLYAALQCLDTRHRNVLTIEDPIEYQLPGIGQIQVKPKIGLTFAHGLRHILRQDPDVVFVGEIRDVETAEIAIRAALTGHLVFSTLHTNDSIAAVIRLIDMGIEPYLLGSALRGSMAQRLVRRLCPSCREPVVATEREVAFLGAAGRGLVGQQVWCARGCGSCLGGYRDRTGLYELVVVDGDLQEAVRREEDSAVLRSLAAAHGWRSLLDDGITKVREGVTSLEELARVVGGGPGART